MRWAFGVGITAVRSWQVVFLLVGQPRHEDLLITGPVFLERPGKFGGPFLPDVIMLPVFPVARNSFLRIL